MDIDLASEYTLWALMLVIIGSFAGAWLGVWLAVRAHRKAKARNHRRRYSDRLEDFNNTGEQQKVEDLTN
jgi:membrane protein YqaA with SNARE-associated domain